MERDRRRPTGTVLVWQDLWEDVAHLILTGYAFASPGSRPTARRLLPNAAAALWLAGFRDGHPAGDVRQAAAGLASRWPLVVVTLGEEGALVARQGREPEAVAPARPARVVDSTGAGDLFAAAFVHAWLEGAGPVEAAAYANACAARLVGHEGARPPLDLPAWPRAATTSRGGSVT